MAESSEPESHTLAGTQPFPVVPSALAGLLSKVADRDVVETQTGQGSTGFRGPAHT